MVDEGTRKTLSNIPLLQTKAGPRDKELWVQRLKEEYQSLIKVYELFLTKKRFVSNICYHFSMCKLIKMLTMIGSDSNLIKKERNGLENVGLYMIY